MKKSCMYALIALTLVAGATLLAACGGGNAANKATPSPSGEDTRVILATPSPSGEDTGVILPVTNNTNGVLFISTCLEPAQTRIEPHTTLMQGMIGKADEECEITVKDESGKTVYHDKTTIAQLAAKGRQPIVID